MATWLPNNCYPSYLGLAGRAIYRVNKHTSAVLLSYPGNIRFREYLSYTAKKKITSLPKEKDDPFLLKKSFSRLKR